MNFIMRLCVRNNEFAKTVALIAEWVDTQKVFCKDGSVNSSWPSGMSED